METTAFELSGSPHYRVSTLPIRNGNVNTDTFGITLRIAFLGGSVSTLPIRNGNYLSSAASLGFVNVSTLPIRNGNLCLCCLVLGKIDNFHVSTLPIRNGNSFSVATQRACLLMLLPLLYIISKHVIYTLSSFSTVIL